jgi:hypothetical protein
MDSMMRLEGRRLRGDGIELIFSRDVSLGSMGGLVSLQLTRSVDIAADTPHVNVKVTIKNTSLSMTVTELPISYRVHNYVRYDMRTDQTVWVDDGKTVHRHGLARNVIIPAHGLSATQTDLLFGAYDQHGPYALQAFGEHFTNDDLLWSIVPQDADDMLQVLRWVDGRGRGGTIEWIERPINLPSGHSWSTAYAMSLQSGVRSPSPDAVRAARPKLSSDAADEGLLFHLDFDDRVDAARAEGVGKATVTGTPTFEDTPTGRGVRIVDGAALRYEPEGNIDLSRGRMLIRFKPLFDGSDGESHELLTIHPTRGYVYIAKLADGRLLMNMFDAENAQHYPWAMARSMRAGDWHELLLTWDTDAGRMALYVDGEKKANYDGEPWQMAPLVNSNPRCNLAIPASAKCVIDEIRIWDRP